MKNEQKIVLYVSLEVTPKSTSDLLERGEPSGEIETVCGLDFRLDSEGLPPLFSWPLSAPDACKRKCRFKNIINC